MNHLASLSPIVVALVSMSSACISPRVALPEAPLASAPLAARDRYYEERKPLGMAGDPLPLGNNAGLLSEGGFPMLQLADGTRVVEPKDLIPAVGIDSPTGLAAARATEAKFYSTTVNGLSALAAGTGLAAVLLAPIALLDGASPQIYGPLYIGGAVVALAGAAGIGVAADFAAQAEAEKMTAFFFYERDLRKRLGLVRPEEVRPLEEKWATTTARQGDGRSTSPAASSPPLSPGAPPEASPDAAPASPAATETPPLLDPAQP